MQTYTKLPTANMKKDPSHSSKIVSQTFFGEEVAMVDQQGEWIAITTSDGYVGWVLHETITTASYQPNISTTRLQAHVYATPDTEYGPLLTVPYDSKLQVIAHHDPRWLKILLPDQREAFIQQGDVEGSSVDFVSFCKQFLGLPYTWGGRSSFGFDCSGFVQMLYKHMGICLERDARQQIGNGKFYAVMDLQLGDLIFWGFSATEIKHVGMALNGSEFIHTSVRENRPYVRISHVSDGEWNGEKGAFYPYRIAKRCPILQESKRMQIPWQLSLPQP